MPEPVPTFDQARGILPVPIFDERTEYVDLYWKAWELACRNFHAPSPESGFVSNLIDAAFNEYVFLWDTCFMTMFSRYGHPRLPGIGSLDNFYVKQHADGEICREIHRTTGRDHLQWVNDERRPLFSRWSRRDADVVNREPPDLTLDALNHPIFTWAEREHYQHTGDRGRLIAHYPALLRYYRALDRILRNRHRLYVTDWASMDNSPRNGRLGSGVDICCEMVLFARHLATVAAWRDDPSTARQLSDEADALAERINRLMWDDATEFYCDVDDEGRRIPIKTIAAYWALLAGVASQEQAAALASQLQNPATFARLHRVPTLAADEAGYEPAGGYWCGAVWAPTNMMVQRGLERYGYDDLAREIAVGHLDHVSRVYQATGTIWENYAPDAAAPGTPAKPDFVGWSGLGPILNLIEYAIGLRVDAPAGRLTWTLRSTHRAGVENLIFGPHRCTLIADARPSPDAPVRIQIETRKPINLTVILPTGVSEQCLCSGSQVLTFDGSGGIP